MNRFESLKLLFQENQDEIQAVKMSKYMKNHFTFYGIPAPKRKSLYKDILRMEKKKEVIDWKLLDLCYNDEHREFQYFVCDYLISMEKYLKFEDIRKMKQYIKEKQWWDTIDCFDQIIGRIGLYDSRIDQLMIEWSLDQDFWLRRLAIDHQLGRKEKTNKELLEQIIINNLESHEFFINKAIGWSLRDYSKVNPQWVRNFMSKYQQQMNSLSIKEASRYL